MIKSLKLYNSCVASMRKAEKVFEDNPTPFNKRKMMNLQEKVDAWVQWINKQEDAELAKSIPPFVLPSPVTPVGNQTKAILEKVLQKISEVLIKKESEENNSDENETITINIPFSELFGHTVQYEKLGDVVAELVGVQYEVSEFEQAFLLLSIDTPGELIDGQWLLNTDDDVKFRINNAAIYLFEEYLNIGGPLRSR